MNTATQEAVERPTAEPPADVKSMLDDVVLETERKVATDTMAYAFDRLEKWKSMAAALIQAGAVPQKNKSEVVTVLMMAHDMGLKQMVALRGMYVVNKKVALETWLMDLVATRLGVTKEIVEETPTSCEILLHRDGAPDMESSFTLEEAKAGGLIHDFDDAGNVQPKPRRDVWRAYTKDMLYWRALSRGLRRIAPDMFGGVYLRDEVAHIDPRKIEAGEVTDTNAELEALDGVEPDPDEMTLDEIEGMAHDLGRAVKAGIMTPIDEGIALAHAEEGRWYEARSAWADMLEALEQGSAA